MSDTEQFRVVNAKGQQIRTSQRSTIEGGRHEARIMMRDGHTNLVIQRRTISPWETVEKVEARA